MYFTLTEEQAWKGKEQLHKQTVHLSNIHKSVDNILSDIQVLLSILEPSQEIIEIVTGILNATIEATREGALILCQSNK